MAGSLPGLDGSGIAGGAGAVRRCLRLASCPIDADAENPTGPSPAGVAAEPPTSDAGETEVEDLHTQRRRLAAVWLAAGSALAAMVGVSWYAVFANGGRPPGGDMIGHAATAS